MPKYIKLNKTKLSYQKLKKIKDLTILKIILEEMEKVKIIESSKIEHIKEIVKKQLRKIIDRKNLYNGKVKSKNIAYDKKQILRKTKQYWRRNRIKRNNNKKR